jgi:hypothetical protein
MFSNALMRVRASVGVFFFNYGVSTVLLSMNEWDCQINVIKLNYIKLN